MKPAPFAFCTSETPAGVVELLVEYGEDARVLAGGQSLVPLLNFRLARPAVLVDIHRISSLLQITSELERLTIGAAVPQRRLEGWGGLAVRFPALADALPHIGHISTRNRGTVGGSMAHGDPAAELPALAVALDAQMTVLGTDGTRTVPASDFFVGQFTTALTATDLLVAIHIPWPPIPSGQAWVEMAYRHGDFALVGCAAVIAPLERRLRLVYAGVGARPWEPPELAVDWEHPLDAQTASIANAAAAACEPSGDQHASADYRRRLVRALTARALERAVDRAGAERA